MVILFDSFNMPESIYSVVFATEQQEIVAKMLVAYMAENNGEITKTEMSVFATRLHEGEAVIKEKGRSVLDKEQRISYNKRQFYDRILTPMKGLGMIDYDLYKKTYRISDRFNKVMIKVGLTWLRELERIRTKK